jgi:hypothetical protein
MSANDYKQETKSPLDENKEKGNQDIVAVAFLFVSSVRAGATGIEPAISALTGPHVSHYTTPPNNLNIIITRIFRQPILSLRL